MSDETSTASPEVFPFEKEFPRDKTPEEIEAVCKTNPQAMPKKTELIHAESSGVLRGSTFQEQYRLAKAYRESGLMPRAFDSTEKVLVALQLCYELNLPPMTSIGKICVINGTPSILGDLPLALVMKSGLCEGIKEYFIDKDGNEISPSAENYDGAVCVVSRKGLSAATLRMFTIADAKVARLWEKKSDSGRPSPWILYPKRMLQMRARSWALKDTFPDVLMGVAILEYDNNLTIDLVKDESSGSQLNKKYLREEENGVQGDVEKV